MSTLSPANEAAIYQALYLDQHNPHNAELPGLHMVHFGARGFVTLSQTEAPDIRLNWRARRHFSRAMSTADMAVYQSGPRMFAASSNNPLPVQPPVPTRTRISLPNIVNPTRLFRRLSPSSATRIPAPPPIIPSATGDSPTHIDAAAPSVTPRPIVVRSSTLPSLGSGWELLEADEEAIEEPTAPHVAPEPRARTIRYAPLTSPSRTSIHPRRAPAGQAMHSPRPLSPSAASSSQLQPIGTPSPSSPCQRVWLCTPPKPIPSPTLAEGRCQRRPAITTRATSTARLGKDTEHADAIDHISTHTERVLAKAAGGSRGHVSRTERGLGLSRSKSAALPSGSTSMVRPEHLRAETTGSYFLSESASTSALEEQGGRARESGSMEPLLEGDNDDAMGSRAGKWKGKGVIRR